MPNGRCFHGAFIQHLIKGERQHRATMGSARLEASLLCVLSDSVCVPTCLIDSTTGIQSCRSTRRISMSTKLRSEPTVILEELVLFGSRECDKKGLKRK